MIIPIVDDNDKIISYKNRNDVTQEDTYRVSALWIINSKKKVLLARRAFHKKHDPGCWGPAVAGTIEKGETYTSNIIKEAFEEIGLRNIRPIKKMKVRISGQHNYFVQWFILKIDMDINKFRIDTNEVDSIKWFRRDELIKGLKDNESEFNRSMKRYVKLFC